MADNIKKTGVQSPPLNHSAYKQVSDFRKEQLRGDVDAGRFNAGPGATLIKDTTNLSNGSSLVRKASASASITYENSNSLWRGPNNSQHQMQPIYSPLWIDSNLNLPRDRATINAWCRAFFALNGIVQNAIGLHATYPISKLNITCPDKKVENFFNEMIEETELLNICSYMAQEYWLLGETFVYADLDERRLKWSRFTVMNPDFMVIKPTIIPSEPVIMMKPDENLRKIVFSNKPSDLQQKKQLSPQIIEHVRRGENIPLDNFYTSHLSRKISPYEIRGTGLPVGAFRSLMLFDLLRECKYVQAHSLVNPITLVKLGQGAEYRPTASDIETWRNIFADAESDKNFKIFAHDAISVERIGASGAVMDVSNDVQQLLKEIYASLMVPQVIIEGGGDITYQNGGVSLDVLRQRYMNFRNKLSLWLKRKVFAPISKLNEFYVYKDSKKELIIPEVEWNHMSLFDTNDYIQTIGGAVEKKVVSKQTYYRSLGLDYEDEKRKLRQENVDDAILKKEEEALKSMNLNELRTITDDSEIQEPEEAPVPGETTETPGESAPSSDSSTPPESSGGGEMPKLNL